MNSASLAATLAAIHERAMRTGPMRPWSAPEFVSFLADPYHRLFRVSTCAEGNTLAGFALIRTIFSEAEILTIAIEPRLHRRGYGSALLTKVTETLMSESFERLLLEVAETNKGALALYGNFNFSATGRRRNYYGDGDSRIDALIMERRLAAGR